MQGNDLANSQTYRYYVTAEVVFRRAEENEQTKRWFSTMLRQKVSWTPDLRVVSHLWRWSSNLGCRLELVFYGDLASDANFLWDLLEKSASNPFNDWHAFESPKAVQDILPFRPDLMGIIDINERSAFYGSRGLRMDNLQ
jgi:hypothetical protein